MFNSLFCYDRADYRLCEELNEIVGGWKQKQFQRLCDSDLHPRGIKELAAPREVRLIYAMHRLLTLDYGPDASDQRLGALRALRDETVDGNPSSLRLNTARVLLQIMKLLIRSTETPEQQLPLAHDLRMALLGQPRFIRRQLRRYHLLEMPEEWNQMTFDDHVHDANTKGRKTPTHLIMDAWIKGIRQLQVIYYNEVPEGAARELLTAAEIMGVDVRIGVEYTVTGPDKLVRMIWAPRGFSSPDNFLEFLRRPEVQSWFAGFAEVNAWRRQRVMTQFEQFNTRYRLELNRDLAVELPPQREEDFLRSVGAGLPSRLHLAEFISAIYTQALKVKRNADGNDVANAADVQRHLATLSPEFIHERYLNSAEADEEKTLPAAMRQTPAQLVKKLEALPGGYRLCLNLTGMSLEDVIEILYDCGGRITHLETFNLKDYKSGKSPDMAAVNALRQAINRGDVFRLKRLIRECFDRVTADPAADTADHAERLRTVLSHLPELIGFYAQMPLGTRLGSDSTGRYRRLHGMGLVLLESLPWREQRRIRSGCDAEREILPVTAQFARTVDYTPVAAHSSRGRWLAAVAAWLNYPFGWRLRRRTSWHFLDSAAQIGGPGNLATLGGYWDEPQQENSECPRTEMWSHLNSNLKIALKVLLGLIPAFLTFYYTQSWWVMIYFGAFIWLGITGVRNVIQAVLGGGGWKRSDLLKWNDFISWQRIADSLLYTGLSVPLLELGVRLWLLQKWLGLNADNDALIVYSVIALVNGFYISGHNWFRGLPKEAIWGNFFRAVVSIPLALGFSAGLAWSFSAAGMTAAIALLPQWAAMISKAASDVVAALIEGYADRQNSLRLRFSDYRAKLRQLFADYYRLEIKFPDHDALELLKSPKELLKSLSEEEHRLERSLIINALDLLYFFKYQPQAATAWRTIVAELTPDERLILLRAQMVLKREKVISQMFLDGLVGKKFAPALAFYLDNHKQYLTAIGSVDESER